MSMTLVLGVCCVLRWDDYSGMLDIHCRTQLNVKIDVPEIDVRLNEFKYLRIFSIKPEMQSFKPFRLVEIFV